MPLTPFGLLRRSVRRHRGRVAASTALLTLWQVCETSVPVFIGLVVDRAVITGDVTALVLWLGAFGLLFLCLSLSYRFGSRLGFAAAQDETHLLRVEIAGRVLSDEGARTDSSAGEVLSLATADTDRVGAAFRTIATGVAALGSVALAGAFLLRINLLLGAVTFLGSTLVLVAIRLLTPRISAHSVDQQATIARTAGMATDFVRGLRPLKGIGGEAVAIDTYRGASTQARDAGIRTARSFGELRGVSSALSGLYLALVAGLAGSFAANHDISLGDLIAVVGIAQFLAEPLATLGFIGATAAAARASAGRIAQFLATEPLTGGGTNPLPGSPEGAPELRIRHTHAGGELDVRAAPGSFTGLVVTDPTLADELMATLAGECSRAGAHAELAGSALTGLRRADVRDRMLVVPHHAAVFAGSIGSNIAPAGTDPAVVRRALDASAADELLTLYDDGLAHPTTSGGGTLSGGQRQRIALARALAADRDVLVLQDPTTAVDAVTEQRIALGIKQFRHTDEGRRTTVVLTSSPAILAGADLVHLVTDDTVVSGTHAELLSRGDYQQAVVR